MSGEYSEQYKPLAQGTVIAQRYEVEKYLGESLLGPTYVARLVQNRRLVALKFIRPEHVPTSDIQKIKTLIKRAKEIKHPSVVQYGNVGQFRDMIFFTQEYFPSKNLKEEMLEKEARQEAFTLYDCDEIISEVLDALSAVHAVGINHTNLQPKNILLRYRTVDRGAGLIREIKITDVMAAAILGDAKIQDGPYRAPECRKRIKLSYRGPETDIYSVGNLLYSLLIGKPATGTYLSPSMLREDLNPTIDGIVDTALAPDYRRRYKSALEMKEVLNATFDQPLDSVDVDSAKPDVSTVLYIVGAVAAIFIAMMIVLFSQEDKGSETAIDVRTQDKELRASVQEQAKAKIPEKTKLAELQAKHKDKRMVYIPAGPFLFGTLQQEFEFKISGTNQSLADVGESQAKVEQIDAYYIDVLEFPNRIQDEEGNPQQPLVNVGYDQAEQACESVGKRLCTAAEWEKACKGFDNFIYSYGDSYDDELCPTGEYFLGKDKECKSPTYGVYGMSSGPREWTQTTATSGSRHVTKGGARGNPERGTRCALGGDERDGYYDNSLSFRCCLDAE